MEEGEKILTDMGERFFEELGKVMLSFPSAICELIDNSISSATDECKVNIDIVIKHYPSGDIKENKLDIIIVDDGMGISRYDLKYNVFGLAKKTKAEPRCHKYRHLREHGFGLKTALAWLTRGTGYNFELRTGAISSRNGTIEYSKVVGPLKKGHLRLYKSTYKEWKEWCQPRGANQETGTRIRFSTLFTQAQQGWKDTIFKIEPEKIKSLESLLDFLKEHLGITYRYILQEGSTIQIRYSEVKIIDNSLISSKEKKVDVKPLFIPFQGEPRIDKFSVKDSNRRLSVIYIRGIVDKAKVQNNKMFYTWNERAQGLDIVVYNKVFESAYFPWNVKRHQSHNGLAGEIRIKSGKGIPTILTKNKLQWDDPLLEELNRRIIDIDYTIEGRKSNFSKFFHDLQRRALGKEKKEEITIEIVPQTETEMNKLLRDILDKIAKQEGYIPHKVNLNDITWGYPRTAADITYHDKRGFFIFECKKGNANPKDLYQLMMYWDGYVCNNFDMVHDLVIRGFLVANGFSEGVKEIRDYINNRTDERGVHYDIVLCRWSDFCLEFGRKPSIRKVEKRIRKFLEDIDMVGDNLTIHS
ncbi:MAG TPA: hypothetical protein ENI33_08395 [Thermoplasmatales archaeon]|nr:hypothetical protein [Thermoplasmatales archaeon]